MSDDLDSLETFTERFGLGNSQAGKMISDGSLDKFALAGTPDDALAVLEQMDGNVDRFEFGTPHGIAERPLAIRFIGESIVKSMMVTL